MNKQGSLLVEGLLACSVLLLCLPIVLSLLISLLKLQSDLSALILRHSERDIVMTRFSIQLGSGHIISSDDQHFEFLSTSNWAYRLTDNELKMNQAPFHSISSDLRLNQIKVDGSSHCIEFISILDLDSRLCAAQL